MRSLRCAMIRLSAAAWKADVLDLTIGPVEIGEPDAGPAPITHPGLRLSLTPTRDAM